MRYGAGFYGHENKFETLAEARSYAMNSTLTIGGFMRIRRDGQIVEKYVCGRWHPA